MTLAPRRIVLWLALIGTATIWLVLSPSKRHALPPVDDPPWIPLPRSGMDAADPLIRELLRSPFRENHGLSPSCGGYHDDGSERYRIVISRNAWEDFREIEIVPHGEWLDIAVRDAFPPQPPDPHQVGAKQGEYIEIHPTMRVRISRSDAEPIRRAWDTYGLWHAEQKPLGCADGRPLTLEACIGGRYAIRHRNCDVDAYASTHQLWDAVTTLLPKPERAHYREH